MNNSFSNFSPFYHTSQPIAQNTLVNTNQHIDGLVRLLAMALRTSVSEYSKTIWGHQNQMDIRIEDSSIVEIEKPQESHKNSVGAISEKTKIVFQTQKNSGESKEKHLDNIELQRQQSVQKLPLSSPLHLDYSSKNKGHVDRIEREIPESWQPPTQCPIIGITNHEIEKKKTNLLQRKIRNWQHTKQKKKPYGDLKSREVRMLLNQ